MHFYYNPQRWKLIDSFTLKFALALNFVLSIEHKGRVSSCDMTTSLTLFHIKCMGNRNNRIMSE